MRAGRLQGALSGKGRAEQGVLNGESRAEQGLQGGRGGAEQVVLSRRGGAEQGVLGRKSGVEQGVLRRRGVAEQSANWKRECRTKSDERKRWGRAGGAGRKGRGRGEGRAPPRGWGACANQLPHAHWSSRCLGAPHLCCLRLTLSYLTRYASPAWALSCPPPLPRRGPAWPAAGSPLRPLGAPAPATPFCRRELRPSHHGGADRAGGKRVAQAGCPDRWEEGRTGLAGLAWEAPVAWPPLGEVPGRGSQ